MQALLRWQPGTVTFRDTYNGITQILGTVQVQSAKGIKGNAVLQQELGGIGTHSIVATFNGFNKPTIYLTRCFLLIWLFQQSPIGCGSVFLT
jgi:hypothetical protein